MGEDILPPFLNQFKSRQMSKTTKDLTLIQSVINNSIEILKLNNVVILLVQTLATMATCRFNSINSDNIRCAIKEHRRRVRELRKHNAIVMKAAYTHKFIVIDDEFHLTSADMGAGFIIVQRITLNKEKIRSVLFLSDFIHPFGDKIAEGEVADYTEDLNETCLSLCKPVYTPQSTRELYLKALKT